MRSLSSTRGTPTAIRCSRLEPRSPRSAKSTTRANAKNESRLGLESVRPENIRRLLKRVAISNRLAKLAPTAHGRDLFLRQKHLAIFKLYECGGAQVEEILIKRQLVTFLLRNHCRPHVPLDRLPSSMRQELAIAVTGEGETAA